MRLCVHACCVVCVCVHFPGSVVIAGERLGGMDVNWSRQLKVYFLLTHITSCYRGSFCR